jgi:hypothetical protein
VPAALMAGIPVPHQDGARSCRPARAVCTVENGEAPPIALNFGAKPPMMEMDTRLWCGACSTQAAIENGTREMNEANVTRVSGPDVARPGWPAGFDRAAPARPETVHREAAPAEVSAAGTGKLPAEHDSRPSTRGDTNDATFPTSYARFSINAETQKLSIKIVDAVTDEVIREIPPEQVQRIAEDLQSLGHRAGIGKRPAGAGGADKVAGGGVDRYV